MSPFTYSSLVVSECVPPTESVPVISVLPVTSSVLDSVSSAAPHLQGGGGLDVAVHVQLLGGVGMRAAHRQRPGHLGVARDIQSAR